MGQGHLDQRCVTAHIILLGAPGSGKGTLAIYLKEYWGLQHISTGDMLRSEVQEATALGLEAQAYMERGELVPDSLIIQMMEGRLKALQGGYILDGFPRTVAQAEALGQVLQRIEHHLDAVVNLAVEETELLRRLTGRRICPACNAVFHVDTMAPKVEGICDLCGTPLMQRKDDTRDAITHRLEVYTAQTQPLIEYYAQRDTLVEIDGKLDPDLIAPILYDELCGGQ